MKKDRNTFFSEAGFNQTNFIPNYPTNYPMGGNLSQAQASQSFYSGPAPMMNQGMNNYGGSDYMSEIESRLSKIERQINRMDARINKLESKGLVSTENYDNTTNMYML